MAYPKKTVKYKSLDTDFISLGEGKLEENYEYFSGKPLWRFKSFLLYRVLATPIAFLYTKLFLRDSYVGREKLKGIKGGYYLFSNHTHELGDAFTPPMLAFPRKAYVVVHPDNMKLPVIKSGTKYLGAIPTPSTLRQARDFSECVGKRLKEGCAIAIYPEARVWKYCSFIRPFAKGAFDTVFKYEAPIFTVTRVYKRSRLFGFKCVCYIDGPFNVRRDLPRKEAKAELSRLVYSKMLERMKENEVEIYRYEEEAE